jgi:hypothetical protein
MVRLRAQYGIRSVLNAPYDHATDPEVDNQPFKKWIAVRLCSFAPSYGSNGFDLVWNFDFLQRDPSLLKGMIQLSRRYVLAFVPNRYNGGQLIHGLYHKVHGDTCLHPERGDPKLMTRRGLEALFRSHNLKVLESNEIDLAPWPDYAISLGVFFSAPKMARGLDIYKNTPHLPMPKQLLAFEELIKPLSFTWGHHCFCLGEK